MAGEGRGVCSHSGDLLVPPFHCRKQLLPGSEPLLLPTAEVASGLQPEAPRVHMAPTKEEACRSALGR